MMKALILMIVMLSAQLARADASEILDRAEALNAEARAMENAWTPTTRLIAEAKSALAEGREQQALELAMRALNLAEASITQAKNERQNWKNRQLVK